MKIWAKTIDDDNRIIKDGIFQTDLTLKLSNYDDILRGVAEMLDIATPIALVTHFKHLKEFNTHRYSKDDFIDFADFKALILEIFREDD